MKDINKQSTSLKIDKEVWKDFRILCLKKGLDASEYVEKVLKRELLSNQNY